MKINCVYDDGAILPQEIINIDPAQLVAKFQVGIRNLAGLSLSAGYPIEATVPLIISNSFRNIAALSLESGYFFCYFRFKIKELDLLVSSGPAVVAPAAKV